MIVITTNNGMEYLPRILESMLEADLGNNKILIIDTGSSNSEFIQGLSNIHNQYNLPIIVDFMNLGYHCNSIIHAYKNFVDDYYIFMHDSLVVRELNFVQQFEARMHDNNIMAWVCYYPGGRSGDYEAENWINQNIRQGEVDKGVFGGIFGARRVAMDKMKANFDFTQLVATKKCHDGAMERGWPILAQRAGCSVDYFFSDPHPDCMPNIDSHGIFSKSIVSRN